VQIIAHNPILTTDRYSQTKQSAFHRSDLIFLIAWAEISASTLMTTAVINCTRPMNLHQFMSNIFSESVVLTCINATMKKNREQFFLYQWRISSANLR
jgi:hypothetical protein